MTAPILQAKHLHKHYGNTAGQETLRAIEDISFAVTEGEFVCLVGPSGCGKTTLLRILAGLIMPDRGEVCLRGKPLTEPSREIGMVFQQANLMPWRTVFNNVRLPLQLQHLSANEMENKVSETLKLVGLADFAQAYPRQLSGGMQQRVAIARALVYQPDILLLDEPFGALDALTRETLNQELMHLWVANRKTVVMVTHNIREAVYLANRVLVMSPRPGRIREIINVPFEHPRTAALLYDPAFAELAYKVRQAIG